MSRKKTPGGLSDEDRDLWQIVATKVERVRLKQRTHPALPADDAPAPTPSQPPYTRKSASSASRAAPPPPSPAPARKPAIGPVSRPAVPPRPRAPALPGIDRRTVRRLSGGQLDIDARLDLHGLTQDEAHRALRAFLAACRGRGDRFALVITGKGGAASVDHGERGVLRRNVPRWLAEPDLAPLVVGMAQAAVRHGGSGALYLRLRVRDI